MLNRLSLRENFLWTLGGNVTYVGCQWGMLVVLAKLGSPAQVGEFALALAVTAPIYMLTSLQLRGLQATDANGTYSFREYFGLRLATTVLALVATCVVGMLYAPKGMLLILVMGLAKGVESVSDIMFGLMQQRERMDMIARSMVLKGILSLAVFGLVFWVSSNLLLAVCGMLGGWTAIMLAYDFPRAQWISKAVGASFSPSWQWARLGKLCWLGLPMGMVLMLLSLNTNIPRYIIADNQGATELGIFAALTYLTMAGNQIMGALGQSASPRLARYYADGQIRAATVVTLKLAFIALVLGLIGFVVALLLGRMILDIVYGPEYAAHADLFVWVMVGAGVSYFAWVLGAPLTAMRALGIQPFLVGAQVAVVLAGSLLLIPGHGLFGAIWVTIIGSVVGCALGGWALLNYLCRMQRKGGTQ